MIEKAFATNAGADACLGLYDKYYGNYFIDSAAQTEKTSVSATGGASAVLLPVLTAPLVLKIGV